jgi:hypothetical protein
MKSNPALDLIPNLDVFLERLDYRCQKGKEYNSHPTMTPLQKLKAILSIEDEFDWILHLRQVAAREPVQMPQSDTDHSNAA